MNLARQILPMVALIISVGCASIPRSGPVGPDLSDQVLERYKKSMPTRFEVMHAVLVTFKPHWWWPKIRQVTLGCSRVDRTAHSYEVTCVSPLGMKLFNISCTNGTISGTLLLPIKGNQDPMVQSIGSAIANTYMDMTPPLGSPAMRHGNKLVMSQHSGDLRTDYTFSETSAQLTTKEYFDGHGKIMTITYSDYQTTKSRSFPARLSLQNHRNGYQLLFLLKEYRDLTDCNTN